MFIGLLTVFGTSTNVWNDTNQPSDDDARRCQNEPCMHVKTRALSAAQKVTSNAMQTGPSTHKRSYTVITLLHCFPTSRMPLATVTFRLQSETGVRIKQYTYACNNWRASPSPFLSLFPLLTLDARNWKTRGRSRSITKKMPNQWKE